MELETIKPLVAKLIEESGKPHLLDVEHSIRVYKPLLSGSDSPASYYIRPPDRMSADEFIEWFEALPGFSESRLTLVSILGIDTFHQPLLSADDYAKKFFHDNQARYIRVAGKSNQAIASMANFVESLKGTFDPQRFPHYDEFAVSYYRPPEVERATVVRLLYMPADHNHLMKVEREVRVHLEENYLGTEIGTSRHTTRDHPPELTLATIGANRDGAAYLQALAESLPRASIEEVEEVKAMAERSHTKTTADQAFYSRFAESHHKVLAPNDLKAQALTSLVEMMKEGKFGEGAKVELAQRGTKIEVRFPRTPSSLWLSTSFNATKHIKELASYCMSLKTDPVMRDGWTAIYSFDKGTGTLGVRTITQDEDPPPVWKRI